MFGLGGGEILLIFLAIVLLFGANKLPELARGMGRGIKEFKKAQNEIEDDSKKPSDENSRKEKS
jgi:sec-independent protein translocase protein TatA